MKRFVWTLFLCLQVPWLLSQSIQPGFIVIHEKTVDGAQKPLKEVEYTYSAKCKLVSKVSKEWDEYETKTWINTEKIDYWYDSIAHHLAAVEEYRWLENDWEKNWRYTFIYTKEALVETLKLRWDDNQWIPVAKESYTYNSKGQKSESIYYLYEEKEWRKESRYKFEYNPTGQVAKELLMLWEENKWIEYSKTTYTYDAQGKLVEESYEWLNDKKWEPSEKVVYRYQGDQLTQTMRSNWDISIWVDNLKVAYQYNKDKNVASATDWVPLDEEWVTDKVQHFIYNPCTSPPSTGR
jgi:hypothetical protein